MGVIGICKLNSKAVVPTYKTDGASGFDFSSIESIVLKAGEFRAVATGLAFELPNGYELQVRPRSGLALKDGITVLNSPGTVDSDYRGEIKVILINHSNEDFNIKIGDRIAQGVIATVEKVSFKIMDELNGTKRGSKGFGSTGSK